MTNIKNKLKNLADLNLLKTCSPSRVSKWGKWTFSNWAKLKLEKLGNIILSIRKLKNKIGIKIIKNINPPKFLINKFKSTSPPKFLINKFKSTSPPKFFNKQYIIN